MTNLVSRIELPETTGPLHERLAAAIERLIGDRRYQAGDRLPTHRDLAQQAGVAIGTVTKALELLGDRGIVRGEVGRGTFVNHVRGWAGKSQVIDLAINGPPQVIPEEIFRSAAERAMRRSLSLPHGGYGNPRGTLEQRKILVDWLGRTRLPLHEDHVTLTIGVQHGVHLAFQDLSAVSRLIATEGATYPGAIAAAKDLKMEMLGTRHDDDGMLPDDLDKVLKRSNAKIVYLTPVCQNPLGFEMGEKRRKDLLRVIEKHDAWIVEDDIYSVYSSKKARTFKEIAPDRTYYLNSISKCLTPLLRVGFIAPPISRLLNVARSMRAEVWGSAPYGIEMACALIELGADVGVASQLRSEAKARIRLAKRLLKIDHVPMQEGAPHIWLPMQPIQAEKLARLAAERGVRLTPPDASRVGGDWASGVRLSVMATENREELETALRTVGSLLDDPDEFIV